MRIKNTPLISIMLILFLFMGNSFSVSAQTPSATAALLNSNSTWMINDATAPISLRDTTINTAFTVKTNSTLTISSATKISYVYVMFDQPPTAYTLSTETETLRVGLNGFLHELITLTIPSTRVTLSLNPGKIASILVYSEGNLPKDVQVWESPTLDADLLVLAAHSDDEALYFGPAIAQSINAGKNVQVAYLTHHFATRVRPHETLDSLWVLGVRSYPIFGLFPDKQSTSLAHAYTIFPKEKVLEYEINLIRRFKPEVILSHDFAGEYGHGAHMVLSDVLKQALVLSSDFNVYPQSAVVYGTFSPLKVYIHLYAQQPILLNVNTPLTAFNALSPLQVARAAYEKHVSQHIWPLKVITSSVGDVRKFGLYYTSLAADTSNDLFEHVPAKIIRVDPPKPNPPLIPTSPESPLLITGLKPYLAAMVGCAILVASFIALIFWRSKRHPKKK